MRHLLALSLFVGLALSCPAQAQTKGGRFDDQIQQDVSKYLQGKKDFQSITAATDDQIVTLTGSVNLYIDKLNLEKKVKKMKNVEGVRDHVTVSSTVPDDQLREKLSTKLAYDRVFNYNAFNAITLKVENGVATIGGTVRDYPARDSALAVVETAQGVKDVVDEIEVSPTSIFDDDLRVQLYRAIYGYGPLQRYANDPQKPIRIIVENGKVTLLGVVNTEADKNLAGIRASGVSGAFRVDNQLLVVGSQPKKKK